MSTSLPPRESLSVEFKSDLKKLPDRELIEALVCLANAEGGELWLGVEDDGTPPACMPSIACWRAWPAWWRRAPRRR